MINKSRKDFEKIYKIIIPKLQNNETIDYELEKFDFNTLAVLYATEDEFNLYHELRKKTINSSYLQQLEQDFEKFIEGDKQYQDKAYEYYLNYATYHQKRSYEISTKIDGPYKNGMSIDMMKKILFTDDADIDIADIAKDYTVTQCDITIAKVYMYVIKYNLTEQEEQKLRNVIKACRVYLANCKKQEIKLIQDQAKKQEEQAKQKRYKEIFTQAQYYLQHFMELDLSKESFCREMKISLEQLEEYAEAIELQDPNLYNKYKNILEQHKNRKYIDMLKTAYQIVDGIRYGITNKNNETRPFEILDYYLITTLSFDDVSSLLKDEPIKLKTFKIFLNKNKNCGFINIKDELNNKYIIGNHTISDTEKLEVIDYLKNHKIPLTTKIYNQALRRHIKGELYEQKKEVDKIKNKY